jgi:hypothetical protein
MMEIDSPFVSNSEKQNRLDICKACDKFKAKTSILPSRCSECGCVLYLKTKFKNQHCPLDSPKW